jgi:hypothetical protein
VLSSKMEVELLMRNRASSLGMMSDEEKRLQRIEDIKELLS